MSSDQNKQIIKDYFAAMAGGDFETVVAALADDVTWWVPPSSPVGGVREGKEAVLGLLALGTDLYERGTMQIELGSLLAEGDSVAAEVVISARTAKGRDYRNNYLFLFRLADGRISSVKEYVDTLYAQRLLFD